MELPENFLQNIYGAFGDRGRQWVSDLPALIDYASRKWGLQIGLPMLLSYNYVAEATTSDGIPVVLKIGVPNPEFLSELAALRFYGGDGCVRLLEADDENAMFFMERLFPGEMLVSIQDDEKRTGLACDVLKRLWRPAPVGLPLIQLTDWFSNLALVRSRYGGATGPFPTKLFEQVESLLPDLLAMDSMQVLLHGDCHHFNILSSDRGWLAIDPKGVIGPAGYDCAPLLLNPIPDFPYLPDALRQTSRRIAIMSERLGLSRQLIRDWGICHAVLSGWWDLSEADSGAEYSMACADIILRAV